MQKFDFQNSFRNQFDKHCSSFPKIASHRQGFTLRNHKFLSAILSAFFQEFFDFARYFQRVDMLVKDVHNPTVSVHQKLVKVPSNTRFWFLFPNGIIDAISLQTTQTENRKVDLGEVFLHERKDLFVRTQFLMEIADWECQHRKTLVAVHFLQLGCDQRVQREKRIEIE